MAHHQLDQRFKCRRTSNTKPPRLRTSLTLPLGDPSKDRLEFFEAQISFLACGVDEWVWTTYFFEDDYFTDDVRVERDWIGPPPFKGLDAPIGRHRSLQHPIWNPREYFLAAMSRRMTQVTKEWRNLISTFDELMVEYVSILCRIEETC